VKSLPIRDSICYTDRERFQRALLLTRQIMLQEPSASRFHHTAAQRKQPLLTAVCAAPYIVIHRDHVSCHCSCW